MMKLHGMIGDRPELVIISDRCIAIKRAVLRVFHIESKFRMSKALSDIFEPTFINATNTYGHEEFKKQLEGLWILH